MTEYDYYVTYRNANDQIRERVEQTRRARIPGQRRHPGRHALARRLHSIADRLEA
ncbi:MAG TPA: hypothetical protein VLB29_19595 [Nocardioidaceae bacterium]|nr:hypothetical protein [Nocardioidaceae bacterium]